MGISGMLGTALFADLAEAAGIDETIIDDIINAERALYIPGAVTLLVSAIQEMDEENPPHHISDKC